jgi:hypothetical protein
MCEDRCLSHGCASVFDYRSGFNVCSACEFEAEREAGWKNALNEYMELREEIGRLEEQGECACDANEFHTCSLCGDTRVLDNRAVSLMHLWGDTWAVKLATMSARKRCECEGRGCDTCRPQ